ncbi:MAG: hypothetical protein ACKVH8_05115 [Pirellulales bacterium]|jgi:hypothetical protein
MKPTFQSNQKLLGCLKACAVLDSELLPDEEEIRCYRFYPDRGKGVQVATYETGGGDDMVVIFKGNSVIIKGFDHESDVSPYGREDHSPWPGMYEGAPKSLLKELADEAFQKEDVTFCFWRETEQGDWQQGPVVFENDEDDGSNGLLETLLQSPEEYIEWGEEYYGDEFSEMPVERIHEVFKENEQA